MIPLLFCLPRVAEPRLWILAGSPALNIWATLTIFRCQGIVRGYGCLKYELKVTVVETQVKILCDRLMCGCYNLRCACLVEPDASQAMSIGLPAVAAVGEEGQATRQMYGTCPCGDDKGAASCLLLCVVICSTRGRRVCPCVTGGKRGCFFTRLPDAPLRYGDILRNNPVLS